MYRTVLLFIIISLADNIVFIQSSALAKTSIEIGKIAKAITVEIKSSTGKSGSGILLLKNGVGHHIVLTARHVVNDINSDLNDESKITIKTPDGLVHKVDRIYGSNTKIDLAIIHFTSKNNYSTAKIGTSNSVDLGSIVYVAGFPKPTYAISTGVLNFTEGKIKGKATRGNQSGYSLIYGNETLSGMSGGPVLNENGELIAIHGQGDREGDGGSGDKTGRNLGIVIERFGIVASSMEIPDYFLKSISFAALPQGETLNAEDYFLLGQAQKIPENMPEAMDNYNKAISLDPKLAIAYASRGSLKFAIAYTFREESSNLEIDIQGAIADLNKAIALDPASNFAYYVRGRFKINLNDVPGAMADLNKAISLNPNSHSYPGSYSYYYRGVLKKDKLKDRKGAIKDFRKALELNKKNNPDGHPDRHYDSIIERLGELGVSTS